MSTTTTASIPTTELAPKAMRDPRLPDVPVRRRNWMREAVDSVAVGTNRVLDQVPWFRSMHDRVLRSLEIVEIDVPLRADQPGLAGLRLAFASDLHAGSYLDAERLRDLFQRIAAQGPDLLCLGGDLVNSRLREVQLYERAVRDLDLEHGVFAVPGNHDRRWARDISVWQDALEGMGVRVLANHGVRLEREGTTMWLCGVDDLTDGRPDVATTLAERRAGECTVVLAHQPDHFVEIAPHGVDLVLSGHTHGGQVRPFGRAWIRHTRHGLLEGGFERDGSRLHVSRGAGTTIVPLRWNARPEVTIVNFRADA